MFLKMSSKFNNKVAVSSIHRSGTQMAGYWIAWTCVLQLKQVFEALVIDPYYVALPKTQQPPDWLVVLLKMPDFGGFTYRFVRAMHGPLCLLVRYENCLHGQAFLLRKANRCHFR